MDPLSYRVAHVLRRLNIHVSSTNGFNLKSLLAYNKDAVDMVYEIKIKHSHSQLVVKVRVLYFTSYTMSNFNFHEFTVSTINYLKMRYLSFSVVAFIPVYANARLIILAGPVGRSKAKSHNTWVASSIEALLRSLSFTLYLKDITSWQKCSNSPFEPQRFEIVHCLEL